jgi:hypothetical protein
MSPQHASRLGWGLWALTLALSLATLPLSGSAVSAPSFIFLTLVLSTVGAVVVSRRPANAIGWMFCAAASGIGLVSLAGAYAVYAYQVAGGRLLGAPLAAWVSTWLWVPPIWLLSVPLLLLFPNGRLLSPRWRWVVWLAAGYIPFAIVGNGFYSWPAGDERGVPNPLGIAGAERTLVMFQNIAGFFLFVGLAAGILSLVLRYRGGGWEARQQLKWFLAAAALLPAAVVVAEAYQALQQFVMPLALALLPIATGIAILKYRLYDIDVLINRTLVYGSLTAALALIYVGTVVLLRQLFASLTGSSELAIVASTLAIAALFTPLRGRIQALIDKRFYRRKYDAAKVLAAFGATVRDETDLKQLTAEMLHVVDETVQPEFVGLWLKPVDGARHETIQAVPET